jgi:hypothetical protein
MPSSVRSRIQAPGLASTAAIVGKGCRSRS